MSVIGDLHDIFRRLSGTWTTHIEHESTESLRLRYGRMRTEFRRAESQVLQDAKPVATYSQIEQVELGQPGFLEGTPAWHINIRLHNGERILVGQSADSTDASVVGARVATAIGCAVVVRHGWS